MLFTLIGTLANQTPVIMVIVEESRIRCRFTLVQREVLIYGMIFLRHGILMAILLSLEAMVVMTPVLLMMRRRKT